MDVKDINQSAAALLFNKVAANSSAEALGAGFASLLGQTTSALDLVGVASEDARPVAAEKTALADSRDIKAPREDRKPAKRTEDKDVKARPEKNRAEKTSKASSKPEDAVAVPAAAVQQPEKQSAAKVNGGETPAVQSAPSAEAAAGTVAAEAAPSSPAGQAPEAASSDVLAESDLLVQPSAKGQPLLKEMTITLLSSSAPMVAAVVDNGMFTIMPEALDLNALAKMSEVSVSDAATGEVHTMSGAELVEKLKAASAQGQLYTYGDTEGKFVNLIPAEIVEEDVSRFTNTVPTNVNTAEAVVYDDENLAAQAAVLDDKIGADKKIKVDVDLRGENFSYRSSSDLVQDVSAVEKAVKTVVAGDDEAQPAVSEKPESQALASVSQAASVGQSQPANQTIPAAAFNPVASAPVADDAAALSVKSIASVSDAGSSALGHAAAGTAEAAAGMKPAEKNNDASFRDIYKGMAKEVVEQVKVNITKSAVKGVDKIDIRLKPEDLGHIEIKMQISKDGKLSAHIISSRPETMEILQKEMQSLQKAFNDAGFQTDDGALSFSFREGGQTGSEGQDRNSGLRDFIGNVFESETQDEFAGNDNLQNWNPAQGLNIRV